MTLGAPGTLKALLLSMLFATAPADFNGKYVIKSAGSGRSHACGYCAEASSPWALRRLGNSGLGFFATAYGAITEEHMWRIHDEGNNSFSLSNVVSGSRILAQSGFEGAQGFFAVADGPVYQIGTSRFFPSAPFFVLQFCRAMLVSTPRVAPDVPRWEFQVQPPEMWMQYPADANRCLEEAFQALESSCTVHIHQYEYIINFTEMLQTNRQTGKARTIRRTEVAGGHAAHPQPDVPQNDSHWEEIKSLSELKERLEVQLAQDQRSHQGEVKALQDEICRLTSRLEDEHARHLAAASELQQVKDMRRKMMLQMGRQAITRRPDGSTSAVSLRELTPEAEDSDWIGDRVKYAALEHIFQSSMVSHRLAQGSQQWCSPPNVTVTRIVEVQNPARQGLYEAARQQVLQRDPSGCPGIPNIEALSCVEPGEHLLFHGCPVPKCEPIARRGFDPQRGGEAVGAMFGKGTYFAQNASKSDLYTTCASCADHADFKSCSHPHGERCIVVARVLLGHSMLSTQEKLCGRSRAPEREDGEPYDSVTVQTTEHGWHEDESNPCPSDNSPFEDQKWHLMMQGDGAFVISNAKSGRRIWAVDEATPPTTTGEKDGGGVSFGASPMLGSEGQSWQDIDESGLLRAELAAERRSKSMLLSKVEERDAKLEMFRREAEAGCPAAPPQWHQPSDLGLLGAWTRTWGVDQTLSLYLLTGLLVLGLLNIHLNLQLQKERGSGQRKEVVPKAPSAAATSPEDPGQGLGQDFGYHVLDTEVNGHSVRLIKIQCPGVEHEDVNVELLFNGCQVRLARRAACGIAAAAWAKRFEFPSQEGIFEFREDQMRLEHGALNGYRVIDEADDHDHFTDVTLDLRKVNPNRAH
ncbi:Tnks [Symbiodinium sp. CCMP2592]|nr:Tnks [Symbiodinium sp. CCMP2592]